MELEKIVNCIYCEQTADENGLCETCSTLVFRELYLEEIKYCNGNKNLHYKTKIENPNIIFTDMDKKTVPKIGANAANSAESLVFYIKLFTPWTYWTWFIAEADFETGEAFGYVHGHFKELGYFDLNEIAELKGPLGLTVERDLYFDPKKFAEVQ